jgi:predicted helicase
MRHQLMEEFSEIYILDLHGNTKTKEVSPDGTPDENVFDIQQGVAICILVKKSHADGLARVFHADLYGQRELKYEWLISQNKDMSSVNWEEIKPSAPFYIFKQQSTELLPEYKSGWKVTEIFQTTSTGIKTHRDHFVIDFDADNLKERIEQFRGSALSNDEIRQKFKLPDTHDWKLPSQRKELQQIDNWEERFTKCLYRPFDRRSIFYHGVLIDRPRPEVMEHLLKPNLTLLTMRRIRTDDYQHFLVSNCIVGKDAVSIEDACYVFPLYLYPVSDNTIRQRFMFDDVPGAVGRRINLSTKFTKDFTQKLGLEFIGDGLGNLETTFGPENIFHYMYAIFYSPIYRERYAEFLKIDFPRLPLTGNVELFRALCGLGADLVALHLL